ncbi:DUF3341 domain-containing protein [candidate division KSB1 bacterium]|nr:DUF3341 domain-containing protein [candidate division KSB1 bacterium]MCH8285860.1 DUF3341 domain-containing protein [candidate division KSB1 bacterium]
MSDDSKKIHGVIAEFANPGALLGAAEKVREAGYSKYDCHSPFPIHGMDAAMKLPRSPLALIIALVAFAALGAILFLQYWTNAVDYPFVISGKPLVSYQAYAPVGFAFTVLAAGIGTFVIMLILNGLPRLHNPLFFSEGISKATDDGFFISIEHKDGKFDKNKTRNFLESIGGNNIELLQG